MNIRFPGMQKASCHLQQSAASIQNGNCIAGTGAAGLGLGDVSVQLIAGMDAWTLRRVLLAVARRFPRTLEAFLCGGLSPAAAELLTARFEAADVQLTREGTRPETGTVRRQKPMYP